MVLNQREFNLKRLQSLILNNFHVYIEMTVLVPLKALFDKIQILYQC